MSAGTVFVELDLDYSKFERNQQKLIQSATSTSTSIEKNFQNLGVKSDKIYDAMRMSATNSLEMIKAKSISTGNEIARAQAAHAATMKRIDDEQYGHQTSLIDSMKKNWLGLTAAVTAAYLVMNRAFSLAEQRAEFEQSKQAFKSMADSMGADAEAVFQRVKKNSSGLIDDAALTKSMNTAMSLGIPIEKLGDLMTVARAKSRDMGITTTQAFDDIARGVGRGSPLILDNLGLMLKLGSANEAMAVAAGKTVEQLTDKEKKMAILNATLEAGKEAVARYNLEILTMKERMDALKVQIVDIKLIMGDVLLRMGAGLMATFQSVSALALGLARVVMAPITTLMLATDFLGITKGKAEEYKLAMEALGDAAQHTAEQAAANFELMRKGMSGVGAGGAPPIRGAGGDTAGGIADNAATKEEENKFTKMSQIRAKTAAAYQKMYQDILAGQLKYLNDSEAISAAEAEAFRKAQEAKIGALSKFYADSANIKKTEEEARLNGIKDAADFYDELLGYEQQAYDAKVALINAERDARIKAGIDAAAANKKAAQEIGALDQKMFEAKARQVHSALGDMASAFQSISSMYDENSKEYARMQEAAKAMIVLQQAVAVANAVAAIANQGLGDPYSAFARIAAMVAAMGSLLASAGIAFGGGGASAPALSASSVLGADAGTGSESISKSWEKMMDLDTLQYGELRGIHNSMKELNANITGLVTSIVRTGDVGAFGVSLYGSRAQSDMFSEKSGNALWALTGLDASRKLTEKLNIPGGSIDLPGKVNEIISGWAGKVFGGGVKKSLTETGIEFEGMTAGQLIAGEYVDALQYGVVKTVKDGGWFGKDKTSYQTIYDELDSGVNRLFELVMTNMSQSLVFLAEGLGTDVDAALAYVFAGEQLDLKGLSAEEMTKKINEYFSGMADTAAETLFGDLIVQYQQLNEGLFETAARLVMDKAIVNEILTMTNQGFSGTTEQVIAFSESLIELAGGLEALTEASTTYYDKFYTDAEKQARLQGQLTGAFGDMGMTLPGSRSGYRALVEGLDLTTEAGKEAYVALMKWSTAADEYYDALGDNLDAQENLTASLKKQAAAIREWLIDLNMSALAPVTSMESYQAEYERQKSLAYAPGATEQDISGFLNYAKEYLSFMRSYGGDYKAIYDAVVGDVGQLGDAKDAQLAAIVEADNAARAAAADHTKLLGLVVQATTERDVSRLPAIREEGDQVRYIPEEGEWYYQPYASGGLTRGASLAGEAGPEWVVPTYEPQRSRFLESAPPQFWENLRGAGVVQPGGGGSVTVHVPVYLNGKVVADVMANEIPRNSNLSDAIRRVN